MTFFGHVISNNGIQEDPNKVETMQKMAKTDIDDGSLNLFGISKILPPFYDRFILYSGTIEKVNIKEYEI